MGLETQTLPHAVLYPALLLMASSPNLGLSTVYPPFWPTAQGSKEGASSEISSVLTRHLGCFQSCTLQLDPPLGSLAHAVPRGAVSVTSSLTSDGSRLQQGFGSTFVKHPLCLLPDANCLMFDLLVPFPLLHCRKFQP